MNFLTSIFANILLMVVTVVCLFMAYNVFRNKEYKITEVTRLNGMMHFGFWLLIGFVGLYFVASFVVSEFLGIYVKPLFLAAITVAFFVLLAKFKKTLKKDNNAPRVWINRNLIDPE